MDDLTRLAGMLDELDDQLAACMRCGFCQAVCPLYAQTGRETDVARGKLVLLSDLAARLIEDAPGVRARLEHCLLCGSCDSGCPSGVPVMDIFLKARAILTEFEGLSTAKKLILRGLLTKPDRFHRLADLAARFQGLVSSPASELLGTSCGRMLPQLSNRHFTRLAKKPFHDQLTDLLPGGGLEPAPGQPTLGLYIGCLIDRVYPRVGQATIKALRHHGLGLAVPSDQACCGIPALSAGDVAAFTRLVDHNLDSFAAAGFDYLITACATCASTIRKLWPRAARLFKMDRAAEMNDLAARTLDITALLADYVPHEVETSPEARLITYHDPCHLAKGLNVTAEPRAVIKADSTRRLVEMADPQACCGMGGSFNLADYPTSRAIGRGKLNDILAVGAGTVATACPACMHQLSDLISQSGEAIDVRHAVEIYAESLGD